MKTLINGESINVLILVMCQFSPIYLFRVMAIEIPTDICIELDKLIQKFIRKSDQESWNEGHFKEEKEDCRIWLTKYKVLFKNDRN